MKPTPIGGIVVCSFESADHLRGNARTYEAIRAAVLEAGRFSVFEATANSKDAAVFMRICADPQIETFDLGYPWTGVRIRGREEVAE